MPVESHELVYGAAALAALALLSSGDSMGISAAGRHVRDRVATVCPSRFPDARFHAMAPSWNPNDPAMARVTTCGWLVGYVWPGSRYGVDGVRTEARKVGAWVDAGGGRRPSPGCPYGLSQTRGGILVHVGVIVDASGETWTTADAGQGTHANQEAAYVQRRYDAGAGTLGGPAGARYLAGWVVVDRITLA